MSHHHANHCFSWNDLVSKSDEFYSILPQFVDGELEDKFVFKLTTAKNKSKYSFLATHSSHYNEGRKDKFEFALDETHAKYYDTKLGFKLSSTPGVDILLKFTDKLIPIAGSSFTVRLGAEAHDENISGTYHYHDKRFNAHLGAIVPLHTYNKIFDLSNTKETDPRTQLMADIIVRPLHDQDIYLGLQTHFERPLEHETFHYDIKAVVATKNDKFEGGVYARKALKRKGFDANEKEEKAKVGVWSNTEVDTTVFGAHAAYDLTKQDDPYKGFEFETHASIETDEKSKILGTIHVIPHTAVSVGYERNLTDKTKFSFGLSYLLSSKGAKVDKLKQVAFTFGLSLNF